VRHVVGHGSIASPVVERLATRCLEPALDNLVAASDEHVAHRSQVGSPCEALDTLGGLVGAGSLIFGDLSVAPSGVGQVSVPPIRAAGAPKEEAGPGPSARAGRCSPQQTPGSTTGCQGSPLAGGPILCDGREPPTCAVYGRVAALRTRPGSRSSGAWLCSSVASDSHLPRPPAAESSSATLRRRLTGTLNWTLIGPVSNLMRLLAVLHERG